MSRRCVPTIDVVVPVYGNYRFTERCLQSLARQTVAHRVIVIDDGSPDDTGDRLAEEWPEATVVRLPSNRGYTAAINLGVEAGTGEFLVLLNNDVELEPDCLEELIARLSADPRCGSAAAVMLKPGGELIDSVGIAADATLAGFARLRGLPEAVAASSEPVLIGPEGTAGAYRRAAWEQVGGLDERISAYMEVLDLALRLAVSGWTTAIAPNARGIHRGSATFGVRSAKARRQAAVSRGYLLRRWRVLHSRAAARTLWTELLVVVADMVLSRDGAALLGRLAGWRAAAGLERRPAIPRDAVDWSISFRQSMTLRRATL